MKNVRLMYEICSDEKWTHLTVYDKQQNVVYKKDYTSAKGARIAAARICKKYW